MKTLSILLLLSLSLTAQTVEQTISYSIEHNYQLEILEEEKAIVDEEEKIVSLWEDPILSVGINDIQAVRPLNRNEEAMQNQYAVYTQSIPLSNKFKVASQVQEKQKGVIEKKQEALKVSIASAVRQAFIEANNASTTLMILDDYIEFLETPMALLMSLSAVEKDSLDRYIKTELLQKGYQLQRENALQRIAIAKEQIELIGNLKIAHFDGGVALKHYELNTLASLLSKIDAQSPELGIAIALKEVALKGVALAKEREQADLKVTGGYYQRFDRNDYVSFAISYPLYTRGKQERQRVQALKRVNIQEITYKQTQVQLRQALKIAYHELKALHQELELLKQSREKILKLIANAKAELSVGGSLVRYYELFSQKVNNRLEQNKKALAIRLTENKMSQLLGEI